MIVLYKGSQGRGKTLTMVKDGALYARDGFKIFRNFNCTFGKFIENEDIKSFDKHAEIDNCVLMIDEIQSLFDARRSAKKENVDFSYFLQQLRKRNIILLCTTQFGHNVDLRLREQCDFLVFPNYLSEYKICEVRYLDRTRIQDDNELMGQEFKPALSPPIVFDARPVFKMYNTKELIV